MRSVYVTVLLAACGSSSDDRDSPDAAVIAPSAPPPLYSVGGAFDSGRGRLVVFGGFDRGVYSGDTWEWDGAWERKSRTGPSARNAPALAYDTRRARVVLFGGDTRAGALGDTWEWDGAAWTRVAEGGPPARANHSLTYDEERGVAVLFGGFAGTTALGDTWTWNGSAWSEARVAGPAPRLLHGAAYDPARKVVVVHGGDDAPVLPLEGLADSWEWDGAAWRRVDDGSGAGPGARDHVSMAYDVELASVVMCGGAAGATVHPFDAWGWNGAAWSKLSDAAPHVVQSVMVTDAARRRVLLYGGFLPGGSPKNELWQWSAGSWARL